MHADADITSSTSEEDRLRAGHHLDNGGGNEDMGAAGREVLQSSSLVHCRQPPVQQANLHLWPQQLLLYQAPLLVRRCLHDSAAYMTSWLRLIFITSNLS